MKLAFLRDSRIADRSLTFAARYLALLALMTLAAAAEEVKARGLQKPVDVLRDQWGVPHIYAQSRDDLFFAQGYMAARD